MSRVTVALYNEGLPDVGYDWLPGDGPEVMAELASDYVVRTCADQDIVTVHMFALDAPIFEDDDTCVQLTTWLDQRLID